MNSIISNRNIIGITLLYINHYLSLKLLWNFLWYPLIEIVQAIHGIYMYGLWEFIKWYYRGFTL